MRVIFALTLTLFFGLAVSQSIDIIRVTDDGTLVFTQLTIEEECVNINNAPIEELDRIIHIGSHRAPSVIELRPFDSISELSRINGIGPSRVRDIKEEALACL